MFPEDVGRCRIALGRPRESQAIVTASRRGAIETPFARVDAALHVIEQIPVQSDAQLRGGDTRPLEAPQSVPDAMRFAGPAVEIDNDDPARPVLRVAHT